MDGREVHGGPRIQRPFSHEVARPLVVPAVTQNELDLVTRLEPLHVLRTVVLVHATPRRLDVDDPMHARIDLRSVSVSPGFDQELVAGIEQPKCQLGNGALQQGFATRQLDQLRAEGIDALDDLVQREPFATRERVHLVAVDAADVAAGSPDERTGPARKAGLSLDRAVDLLDLDVSHTGSSDYARSH